MGFGNIVSKKRNYKQGYTPGRGGTKRLCQRDGEQLSWGAGWELKHKAVSWVTKGGTGVPTEGPAHAKGPVEVETQCGGSSGRGEAGEKDQS